MRISIPYEAKPSACMRNSVCTIDLCPFVKGHEIFCIDEELNLESKGKLVCSLTKNEQMCNGRACDCNPSFFYHTYNLLYKAQVSGVIFLSLLLNDRSPLYLSGALIFPQNK